MSMEINKSLVPRVAVERTIRRAVAMFETFQKTKATPEVIAKIEREVVHQANILNIEGQIKDDETSIGSALYAGRRKP